MNLMPHLLKLLASRDAFSNGRRESFALVNLPNDRVRSLLHLHEHFGEINPDQPDTEDGDSAQQPDRDDERRPAFEEDAENDSPHDQISGSHARKSHDDAAQIEDKDERLVTK